MKLNVRLELSEDSLRRVRAGAKRGGRATRAEVRIWVNRLVAEGVARLPAPVTRRKRVKPPLAPLKDTPPEERCARCTRPFEEHGKMAYTCPPMVGVAKIGTFTRVAA